SGMSSEIDRSRTTVEDLAERFRSEMIPLSSKFSYFCTLPMEEDDLRQYLHDPIAALSPAIVAALPQIGLILAPYLEKGNGKSGDAVTFERPVDARQIPSSRHEQERSVVLALGVKVIEVADYHYQFYNALAALVADHWSQDVQERFH